ncbi:MAG: GNAT family N-acetyltransferase [Rhodobacteraceae bacterium]|nr:GNAT family N-acetyltransferase [Paracoccaceae bacterium]
MTVNAPQFIARLATSADEIEAAQRLRYQVFVEELGGAGDLIDHEKRLEQDRFDPFFDHLLLYDVSRENDPVVGVYRLLRGDKAEEVGQFYSEDEYDLTILRASGRKLLELGRSCLHADYRGSMAMFHLWNALARYVFDNGIEVLFGVASFHGTDANLLAQPLSHLNDRHLAPVDLRVRARAYQPMTLVPADKIDRRRAVLETPALIKAYLKLGGFVGDGAFVDHRFNTTDVCLVLDTARMNEKQKNLYLRGNDR